MAGLKIAFISTFPPKICGISSFTRDLINGIKSTSPENYCQVIALTSPQEKLKYGPEVTYQVDSNNIQSYVKAADLINQSNLDVVSLQHEYGIFGGEMGLQTDSIVSFSGSAFKIPVSDTQAYKQFGNSVVVPVVHEIAVRIVHALTTGQTVPLTQRATLPTGWTTQQLPLFVAHDRRNRRR